MRGSLVAVVLLGGCGGNPRLGPGGGPEDTGRGRPDTGAPSDSSGVDSGAGATDTGGSPPSACDGLVADPVEPSLVLGSRHADIHIQYFVALGIDGVRACYTYQSGSYAPTYRRGGVLTASGAERARRLAEDLVGVDLQYVGPPCSGCADEAWDELVLRRQGLDETFVTSFGCIYANCDFEFMPPELVGVEAFTSGIERALREGTTTEDVVPDDSYEWTTPER